MSNDARKQEAHDETTAVVSFRGHEFTVPRDYDDWPIEFLEAMEDGKAVAIVRAALGPEQWHAVKQLGLKVRDLDELSDRIAAAMGFKSAGESSASSD